MKYILFLLASLQLLAVDTISRSVTYGDSSLAVRPSGLSFSNAYSSSLDSSTISNLISRGYVDPPAITNAAAAVKAATWGDSLTSGDGSASLTNRYPAAFERFSNLDTSNGGVSGETSTQIRTRQTAASNTWTYPTIIWAGRNNYVSTNTVKADIAAMVVNLATQGNTNRFLVLSIINGNYADEYIGQTYYSVITNLNADLAATYGANYVDVRSFLVSQYNPALAQDVIDFGRDIPPNSLRADNLHLNDAGYLALAGYLYTNKLAQLRGSWSSAVTPSTLAQLLLQAPTLSAPTLNGGTAIQVATPGAGITHFIGFTSDPTSTARELGWRTSGNFMSDLAGGAASGNGGFFLKNNGTADTSTFTGLTKIEADAAGSAATYFPVFTADPSTGTAVVKSRTAAQVLSDIGASSGTGTVTNLSVIANNGISASVSAATTSPVITLGLDTLTYASGTASAVAPYLRLNETDAAPTNQLWGFDIDSSNLTLRTRDGLGGAGTILSVDRSGATVTTVALGGSTVTIDGTTLTVDGSNDRVGIGTGSPGYPLSVVGRISHTGGIGEGADLQLSSSSTTIIHGASSTWTANQINAGGTNALTVNKSGSTVLGPLTVSGPSTSIKAPGIPTAMTYIAGWTGDPSTGATIYATNALPVTLLSGLGTGVADALALAPTGTGPIVLATSALLTTPTMTNAVIGLSGSAQKVAGYDSSGNLSFYNVSKTEVEYLSGVTSSIQTQLNAKGAGTVTGVAATVPSFLSISGSPITSSGTLAVSYSGTALPVANGGTSQTSYTTGDLLYASGSGALSKLAIGSAGQVLTVAAGIPSWATGGGVAGGGNVYHATTSTNGYMPMFSGATGTNLVQSYLQYESGVGYHFGTVGGVDAGDVYGGGFFGISWNLFNTARTFSVGLQAPSGLAADKTISVPGTTGDMLVDDGVNVDISAVTIGGGTKLNVVTHGTVTLSGATTVVSTAAATANGRIFLTSQVDGGTPGWLRVSSRSAGVNFTITSSTGASDTSTVAWMIVEP